jgi:pullulanase-type alpha-1,6-glucosidase
MSKINHRASALSLFVAVALWALPALSAQVPAEPEPQAVTIAGSLQSELGCPGDWQPDCAASGLIFDAEDGIWQRVLAVPAGDWEYKAPLNGSWDVNFGTNGIQNGANIPLALAAARDVKFYYSHATHWVTDAVNSTIAVAPGNFQSELGCNGDWDPSCLRSWLQDVDGDGLFSFTAWLPAGDYEAKVALNESWDVNFGAGGVQNGANIPFNVLDVENGGADVTFFYDDASHELTISLDGSLDPEPPQPQSVTIAGSLQSELGCPGDWQPDCAATGLAFDAEDRVWQRVFNVPAGDWEYKAPLNGSWDLNFGANGVPNGANIALSLGSAASVKFYYSNATHWVTDNRNSPIAVAAGSFQSELGCNGDWDPSCLRSWLQDADGDGVFKFSARLPAGDYEAKVPLNENWDVNFGAGGVQNGANIAFNVPPSDGPRDSEVFFAWDRQSHVLQVSLVDVQGDLRAARAHWLSGEVLAWNPAALPAGARVFLHADADAGLRLMPNGVEGGESIELLRDDAGISSELRSAYPHLQGLSAFRLPTLDQATLSALLKTQLAVSVLDAEGNLLDATGVQIPGVLDERFTFDGTLGAVYDEDGIGLRLWAPTAQSVRLLLFDDSDPGSAPVETRDLLEDIASGVWQLSGPLAWDRRYYLFEVAVFAPSTSRIEVNRVTDPYSLSLAANSVRSQFVDLNAADLKPRGWHDLHKPAFTTPEDMALYELHVRDFSIGDDSVPAAERGTFRAFAHRESRGMRHLARLARAGISHVHLLPSFDFATVPEKRVDQAQPAGDLASYAPDGEQQQAAIAAVKDSDGFNWGYDPFHYTVPEGSYATDPDGSARIREFRAMVQGLNRAGLRVVMDVVYNHTTSAGQNERSVLDKVVPGYYHRLNLDGAIETSSCCPNTASEHRMMEKLLIDSVLTWATQYRVDGFRFDLMGHHMKANMVKLRQALDALTRRADGIDGASIYLYGEGWNFGEVADNARGQNAIQRNMAGTGIGTFNDRLRDGLRGGNPFGDLREQGFATGLYTFPNDSGQGDAKTTLLRVSDWVRIGLAGTLAGYEFVDAGGASVRADQIDYFGQRAGYTADPQEDISYAAAHDNETLFDVIQLKAARNATLAERVRMQAFASSLIALGQGIPFFHAGQDILRSKGMDRDSFNAGDWFNALDWSLASSGWGRGLPSEEKNKDAWPLMRPLLADPSLAPGKAEREQSLSAFERFLRIRNSSPLFRLRDGEAVRRHLHFHNTGPEQVPGLIVMSLDDVEGSIDRRHRRIVTLFNGGLDGVDFVLAGSSGAALTLHPLQIASDDPVLAQVHFARDSGSFAVPGLTTAVFVEPRPLRERIALLHDDIEALHTSGAIGTGLQKRLRATLRRVDRQIASGQGSLAAHSLRTFITQAGVLEATRAIRAEAADLYETLQVL